ncbi:ATP-binding protein [Cellulomonas sp. MW9]|uniref:ATP-binding protein n=2 Tax=Cellulomonas edaphi TaxID=3053468 RepID=A0ABT7S5Y0_9CELL|nr:ATP-binding protein [Cellulomons edaphi]
MCRVRISHLSSGSTSVRFIAHPSAIPHARHWAAEQARVHGFAPHSVHTVELLVTEAVTNAVMHGPPAGAVQVSLDPTGATLRVSVRDDSDALPVLRTPPPTALSGRGVLLIDRLADAWGVQPHTDGGKTVWFEVVREEGTVPGPRNPHAAG